MQRFSSAALELSADGVVQASNGRLDALVGRDLTGLALSEVLDPSSQPKWQRILSDGEAVNPACTWELVFVTPGSLEVRTFLVVPGGGGSGAALRLLEHATDSRIERLYDELSELNRELVQAQREVMRERKRLRRALDRAEAAIRSRDDVLAIVSHDLRTPLSTISMAAELLQMQIDPDEVGQQIGLIRSAVRSMGHLISDLLDVGAIESGRFSVEREPLRLYPLLEEARRMLAGQAAAKRQRIELEAGAEVPEVRGDRDRLLQALSNLVGNAVKFTPESGVIRLGATAADGEVIVSVQDTGPGIPDSDVPRIFDRFWRTRQRPRGGAGLGLAITKGIVAAHGGRIWVKSRSGEGTSFFFTIPIARRPPD
jgi:signal transduction histidine kinase